MKNYHILSNCRFLARKTNLHIKEDKSKGIFVQDATEVYVNSVENMKKVMKTGAENRLIKVIKH